MAECNILWSGKYHQNWETDLHSHNFFQMIGFEGGNGSIQIDEATLSVDPRQGYLVLPQQMHSIYCAESTQPLKILDIKFSVSNPELFQDLVNMECRFEGENFTKFQYVFNKIISESALQQPYYYSLISGYLYEMLIFLLRNVKGLSQPENIPEPVVSKQFKGVDVEQLMQYIHFNYSNIISLDDLSAMAKVNKTTLISIFKDLYGTTPIRYVNSIRLQKAKELLVNTDTSVGEIAELIGFQSIHYFSRYFRSKENCTPIEYRMRNAKCRYFNYL